MADQKQAQRLDNWIAIEPDGTITAFSGKVELGTGVRTALAQIVAEELDVPLARDAAEALVGRHEARIPAPESQTPFPGGPMLKEFRDFVLRGNIVELAIAFVLGVAFGALITSFVDNLLMPVVAMIIGKPDFRDLTFAINDSVFRYGAFLTDAISFVAVAAAVFVFVVKPMNALRARRAGGAEDEGLPDEERRHQELLAALRESRA